MTALEEAAIELHDYMWENLGISDEWPLHMHGDDDATTEVIRLMNRLQDEIKASGYAKIEYQPK